MNLDRHPCFNDKVRHQFARVHVPIAPLCNIQCNYCERKYDCVNESRPGVTSAILLPQQALEYVKRLQSARNDISVVGIAGPGDPFANPIETMDTLRLVRAEFPQMLLCVATNGLELEPYVKEMAALAVSHVTITVNAVDPEVGGRIYAWVRKDRKIYRGSEGARVLLENQLAGIKRLKECGIMVKINIIVIPGINDGHIIEVVKKVKECGADIVNCIPMFPNANTGFGAIPQPSEDMMQKIRAQVDSYMPQMHHCQRCRADAAGLLGEMMSERDIALLKSCESFHPALSDRPVGASAHAPGAPERAYVAVASREGMLINQHLGEAAQVFIYGYSNGKADFLGTRPVPPSGGGDRRWEDFVKVVNDCKAILVSGTGARPKFIFANHGIRVVQTEGLIEETLVKFFEGKPIRPPSQFGCGKGVSCSGNGGGCGG